MKNILLYKLRYNTAPGRLLVLLCAGLLLMIANPALAAKRIEETQAPNLETVSSNPIPTLAYYYIWFDSSSWNRAKTDYPQLGRYSSDDRGVMRQHIKWAKAAGMTGFIVSWKSTEVLNRRLEQLIDLAEEEDFKLALIYQGLDFYRNPLPIARIQADLDIFTQRFGSRKPFDLFAKPLVIWSGTWEFTPDQISLVSARQRNNLLLLASERNQAAYEQISKLVDGNAYYWSSVNPETFPGYQDKLIDMSETVHKAGGIWIAPAAPGFDAHLIGGTSLVDRKNGDTFRTQINTALASSPDALGIISWNEFSENSHIEPSEAYSSRYLEILSEINLLPAPIIADFDSSEIAGPIAEPVTMGMFLKGILTPRVLAFGLIASLVLVGLVIIAKREKK